MNGTLLHVTRQHVAYFVCFMCVNQDLWLDNNIQKAATFHTSVEPFRHVASERLVIIIIHTLSGPTWLLLLSCVTVCVCRVIAALRGRLSYVV